MGYPTQALKSLKVTNISLNTCLKITHSAIYKV